MLPSAQTAQALGRGCVIPVAAAAVAVAAHASQEQRKQHQLYMSPVSDKRSTSAFTSTDLPIMIYVIYTHTQKKKTIRN